MTCPVCHQPATTYLRSLFTTQGVSAWQSVKGRLTCQSCGIQLQIAGYGSRFWWFYIPTIIVLNGLLIFHRSLEVLTGLNPVTAWVLLVAAVAVVFATGIWNHGRLIPLHRQNDAEAAPFTEPEER